MRRTLLPSWTPYAAALALAILVALTLLWPVLARAVAAGVAL